MKKITAFLMCLVLVMSFSAAVCAEELDAENMPKIIDETGLLMDEASEEFNELIYPETSEKYSIDLRVNIVQEIPENEECADTAEFFYNTF